MDSLLHLFGSVLISWDCPGEPPISCFSAASLRRFVSVAGIGIDKRNLFKINGDNSLMQRGFWYSKGLTTGSGVYAACGTINMCPESFIYHNWSSNVGAQIESSMRI
jgi:hypothetical protein